MRSIPAAVAVAAVLALSLSGCVPQAEPTATPSPTRSATQQPSSTPSATPAQTPTSTPTPSATKKPAAQKATPVRIDCNTLVSPQAVYDYNPNYGHQPDFTPASGTRAAAVAGNQGVVCNWVNQTSGETFVVAVAQPAADVLASTKKSAASGSKAVSGLGDAAYFKSSGGQGVAEVFSGPYWVVASSSAFFEIAEAKPLIQAALAALGR